MDRAAKREKRGAGIAAETLGAALVGQAESDPNRRWLTLLDASGSEESLDYGELLESSRRVAEALESSGVKKGQPVPIILPTSTDFISTLFGTLLIGAIPVPLYPPVRMHEMEKYANQLVAILRECGSGGLVTAEPLRTLVRWMLKPVSHPVSVWTPAELRSRERRRIEYPILKPGDTALIQYTSGSTGNPKGVELTHANLLSNIHASAKALNFRKGDVGVMWLPLYHDMGLIGAVLGTMCYAIPIVLLSPVDFIRDPKRWLWAIHRYRGTLSAAPNFAYSLCLRKIKDHEIKGLDLSTWRVAISGAEFIYAETLDQFSSRFGPYGFSRTTFLPAYGLAESSLAVTFPGLGKEPTVRCYDRKRMEGEKMAVPVSESARDPNTIRWVSVGRPIPGHRVRIVDEAGCEVPERTVGEVTVQGPSVMKGYYRKSRATEEVLKNGWLYTGDLGFLDEAQLYITGRSKDLIIKAGKNYYPHDLEAAAASVEGVRPGCVSVFGVPNPRQGTEEIILVAETRIHSSRRLNEIRKEIIKKVNQNVGCSPDRVVLVPPGSVAKTSSGKVQRFICRQRYLKGELHRSKGWVVWQLIRLYFRSLAGR